MSTLTFIALAFVVTASMVVLDVAHAHYSLALVDARRGERVGHRAARWSVLGWAAGTVCFYLTVRYTMSFLVFEGLGLYIGSLLGTARAGSGVVPGEDNP